MTNKAAIKEIERLRDCYYSLCENILEDRERGEMKEIRETTDKIQKKIYALDVALTAMYHVEMLTTDGRSNQGKHLSLRVMRE